MARLLEVDGAGNRFVLWDARGSAGPQHLEAAGRAACDPASGVFDGAGADGLLLLLPAVAGANARLVIVNSDGSRPEMCGNGLRCVARYMAEDPHAPGELVIETDAGPLPCRVARDGAGWRTTVRVGFARVGEAFTVPFPGVPRGVPAFAVDVGNPHAVLDASHLGVRLADAPLAELAAATLAAGRAVGLFPAGANVELVEVHGDHLRARVFERGVGETQACGTGAGALAAVALERLDLGSPIRVHMPGGLLEVERDDSDGALWLTGPVRLGRDLPAAHAARLGGC